MQKQRAARLLPRKLFFFFFSQSAESRRNLNRDANATRRDKNVIFRTFAARQTHKRRLWPELSGAVSHFTGRGGGRMGCRRGGEEGEEWKCQGAECRWPAEMKKETRKRSEHSRGRE